MSNALAWSNMLIAARRLSTEDVRRHASVSTGNRHTCRECFTCACVVVLQERTR